MADEDHHTYTVNGRISSKEEYDTHARYMDELDISGQKLFREKMKKGDATADEVIDALIGIGYAYDPKAPLKKAKGGLIKSHKKSKSKRDGAVIRGKTRAKYGGTL
jgi:NAD(P)H-hydrate repair Nnr-like enzyme with NAD(P)H-hydrate epimerase domain